jgi:hypothetical protein
MRFPTDVILVCIRWYVAYPLSYRHIEELMGFCRVVDQTAEFPRKDTVLLIPDGLFLPAQKIGR